MANVRGMKINKDSFSHRNPPSPKSTPRKDLKIRQLPPSNEEFINNFFCKSCHLQIL